jgi:hypothetical protein
VATPADGEAERAVEDRLRWKRKLREEAPKVEVIWHGPAVTMDGVTVGPYPDDEVVDVPNWVPSLWAENARTTAEARRFANRLAKTPFLGEYV